MPEPYLFIDPPSGWQFGFPKQAPANLREMTTEQVHDWLVENGYPRREIDLYVKGKLGYLPFRIFGG